MNCLGELVFAGLGLYSERAISLLALEAAREAGAVFVELYTSLMPEFDSSKLEKLIEKRVTLLSRRDMEEECGRKILQAARKGRAVLLVPGDPLIATTHVELRIRAEKQGIKTSVVHGASIISAVVGLSGLQNYKFGRSVTIPFSDSGFVADTPYKVVAENRKLNLHTLCFLDVRAEEKRYMTVQEGLEALLAVERREHQQIVTSTTLAVGIARAGSNRPAVRADQVGRLLTYDFGPCPHSLILPAQLHFVETEALIVLAKAPETIRETEK